MIWRKPKTIIGSPAEGDKYLTRPAINEHFWYSINNGEHILFTAPRRVGKSSVMKDLEKTAPEGIIVIYQNIEADGTATELYKRLFKLILQQLSTVTTLKTHFTGWLKTKKIGEFSLEGTFKLEQVDANFKQELLDLIEELGRKDQKVVLLLDEFPDVVNNIRKNEGDAQATEMLHVMRAIRHESKFKGFSLVLAGSIGLEHVIASVDRIKLINDLKRIPIEALHDTEVHELLEIMLADATIQLGDSERDHLKNRIGHWLPFYFQLMMIKCDDIAQRANTPIVTNAIIDAAMNAVLQEHEHFSDWEKRLKVYLEPTDHDYCIGLLTRCAHGDLNLQQAYDFSKTTNITTSYKSLLDDVLVKDGYLVIYENRLQFLSPFLQAWWKNRHPAFEIER